jgi:hypothetical protein
MIDSQSSNLPSILHQTETTLSGLIECEADFQQTLSSEKGVLHAFPNAIANLETELFREKYFFSENRAQQYIDKAKSLTQNLQNEFEKFLKRRAADSQQYYARQVPSAKDIAIKRIWIALLVGLWCGGKVVHHTFTTNAVISIPHELLIALGYFLFFGIGAFIVIFFLALIDRPGKVRRALKEANSFTDNFAWGDEIQRSLEKLSEKIDRDKSELLQDAANNKNLLLKIKSASIDDYFQEKASKRSLTERIEIIDAEARAATATAKTLDEQHLRTEEVRLKYAKELIDLQRQVKAEDNQDLTDKLQLLQSVLGEGA